MLTIDERTVASTPAACFAVAADVERWPDILPHYRYVRFERKDDFGRGRVRMAAWRDFGGPIRYPTWWTSEMTVGDDEGRPTIHYRHVAGVTTGMRVLWEFLPGDTGTLIRIVHEWDGPRWPLIGTFAADRVIGPHFVSAIAQRTLAGVARAAAAHDTAGSGAA